MNALLDPADFDVLHDHTTIGPLLAGRRCRRWRPCTAARSASSATCSAAPTRGRAWWRSRAAQRRLAEDLPWAGVVHNGVAPERIPRKREPTADGPVLWLARFSADKGPEVAIRACRDGRTAPAAGRQVPGAAGAPLLHRGDRAAARRGCPVMLNADRRRCLDLLLQARCLIMPLQWDEPFGMVMVEAMADRHPGGGALPGRGPGDRPARRHRPDQRRPGGAAAGPAPGGTGWIRGPASGTSRRTSPPGGWPPATSSSTTAPWPRRSRRRPPPRAVEARRGTVAPPGADERRRARMRAMSNRTTAFVLGGGGVLGAVEVGMLRALFRAGIRPDLVVGTSIGAVNGALVAADPTRGGHRPAGPALGAPRRPARSTATRSPGSCAASPPVPTCTRPGRCAGCSSASWARRPPSPT